MRSKWIVEHSNSGKPICYCSNCGCGVKNKETDTYIDMSDAKYCPHCGAEMESGESEIVPGVYRHFKGGNCVVITTAKHTETGEEMVVYQSLDSGNEWVRPASMWNEVVWKDGAQYKRFELLEEYPDARILLTQPGTWLDYDNCEKFTAKCSVCGNVIDPRFGTNFCPRCGADMRNRNG